MADEEKIDVSGLSAIDANLGTVKADRIIFRTPGSADEESPPAFSLQNGIITITEKDGHQHCFRWDDCERVSVKGYAKKSWFKRLIERFWNG